MSAPCQIGVISDTHGLLRPEAVEALRGSDIIIHAGDIGPLSIIATLRELAPVTAVRGNIDTGTPAALYPLTDVVTCEGQSIYVLHDLATLDLDPVAAGFRVVISGHSHRPEIRHEGSVLYLNPGSAGPRRFSLPITLARLEVSATTVEARLLTLAER